MLDPKVKNSKVHKFGKNKSHKSKPKEVGTAELSETELDKKDELHSDISVMSKKKRAKNNESSNSLPTTKRKKVKKQVEAEVSTTEDALEEEDDISQGSGASAKKPSKRQLKREKAEQREAILKDKSKTEAMEKALEYVSKWKHNRSNWKFEKLRQIWLMDHLLDENSIPDAIFSTVLEYFDGCKGMAREQLIKKGMSVMKKAEDEENEGEITESVAYKRARQLLQVLPANT